MKVLFDHEVFCLQRYGGISRYFASIMHEFAKMDGVTFELALRSSDNAYVGNVAGSAHKRLGRGWGFYGRAFVLEILNRPFARRRVRAGQFDIMHPTYYYPYFLDALGAKPFVLTVYDMIHELYGCSKRDRTQAWKKLLASKASAVIAISESTRQDMMRLWGMPKDRIHVIPLASSLDTSGMMPLPEGVPDEFVLFVGGRGGYKNFKTFGVAMADVLGKHPRLRLVCAGGGRFVDGERRWFEEKGLVGRCVQLDVTDAQMVGLYRKARAFVFPSSYEGFGIPLLEAFACGCPVAASDIGTFREVCGEAATYFDPADPISMREAIGALIGSELLRQDMCGKGVERGRLFTWRETAGRTLAVYEKAMQMRRSDG